jgi:peptidoglycan/LPS O-acetylase OafA/YrhL/lysophospholipase L1-like esterase
MATRPASRPRPEAYISRVPYLPGLDGMRAMAVVGVMLYHAKFAWIPGGFLGVEVFFVISGYLITLLLIAEHERSGRVDLPQFWYRRAKRLLPALFFMMSLLAIYVALFKSVALGNLRGDTIAGIFYVSNWYQVWTGAGYTAAFDFAPLRHLWSLAVEEQFYLLAPVLMVFALRRGRHRIAELAPVLVGAAAAIAVAVAALYSPGQNFGNCEVDTAAYWHVTGRCVAKNDALYLSTFSRAGGLLLGAAFAMVWRPMAILRGPLRARARLLDGLFVVGLLIVAVQMWRVHLLNEDGGGGAWLYRGGLFVTGVATLLMIAAVTHRDSLVARVLQLPVINWIGTRSYGLYLFHWPIYQILREEAGAELGLVRFLIAMPLAAVITEISYRYVETPIRQEGFGVLLGRRRPRPRRARVLNAQQAMAAGGAFVLLLGFAVVRMSTAEARCDTETKCSLVEGEAVVVEAPGVDSPPNDGAAPATEVPSSDVPSTDPAGDPGAVTTAARPTLPPAETAVAGETAPPTTVVDTTLPPTTTAPPAPLAPLAIGDSVMLGAAEKLAMNGIRVDAVVSRQAGEAVDVIRAYKASGQLGDVVIIHIGTNGEISQGVMQALLDELAATPRVLWLTARVDRGWTEANNNLIRGVPTLYPGSMSVLDWNVVGNECVDDCFASDGIHLNKNGRIFYANKIAESLGLPQLAGPDPAAG